MNRTSRENIGQRTPTLKNLNRALSLVLAFFIFGSFRSLSFGGLKTGADFLKIPVGAEPISWGQAYTARAEGAQALNWNPAGAARFPAITDNPWAHLSFSHQSQFGEANLDNLGIVIRGNHQSRAAYSINFLRLSFDEQEARGLDRQKNGTINSNDLAVGAGMAYNFGIWQGGTQVKIIQEKLANQTAAGYAVDFGMMSNTPFPALKLGAAVRNLGPQMKFIEENYQLPLTFTIGSSYQLSRPLALACDLQRRPHDHETVFSIGSEFVASKMVALRAGYLAKLAEAVTNRQQNETNRGAMGRFSGMTAGLGMKFQNFVLDYSLAPFGELGDVHTITVATAFGRSNTPPIIRPSLFSETDPKTSTNKYPEPDSILILSFPPANESWWTRLQP